MKKLFLKSVLVLCVVLFSSSQIFSQWVAQTSGTTVRIRNIKAVNDNVVWACGGSGVVLKTTNGGTTWRALTPTLATATNYTVDAFDTTTAWVTGTVGGTADVSIWKTTDGGTTWVSQYNNPTGFGDAVRFFDANNGVYFGDPDPWPSGNWELLTTSNSGTNWNRVPRTNFPPADSVNEEYGAACAIEIFGNTVWFGAYSAVAGTPNRIYKSTNKGLNWTVSGYNPISGTSGSHFMAFSSATNGVDLSLSGSRAVTTDGGATWTVTPGSPQAYRFVTNIPGFNSFIGVGSAGLAIYSNDAGSTWTTMTSGTTVDLYTVDATANAAWAAGNSGTILRLYGAPVPVELTSFAASVSDRNVTLNWATATEINNRGFEVQRKSSTGDFVSVAFIDGRGTIQQPQSYTYIDKNVEFGKYTYRLKQVDFNGLFSYSDPIEVDARIPAKFGLNQNYPNPFNPTTTISYEIAKETVVSLKVYDVIGNEIATLVNETKAPGTYDVIFDASKLSNGVYLYKIHAGNFTATKKLILIK
jgi:photosystem II stability/assembly factor-like uncharacterized protein